MTEDYPIILAFITAALFYLITNSADIKVILKKNDQRTESEKNRIKRGLFKEKLFDMILFVPISVALFFMIVFPLINKTLESLITDTNTRYSMMGIIAYGFPFATVKRIISKIALNALKEFANIIDEDKQY